MSVLPGPAVVLVVCTGNICRSPVAERVLQAGLDAASPADGGVRVRSAGTAALVGAPMTEEAERLVRLLGGDPSGHRARSLDRGLVEEAALVLTATREHRGTVVRLVPSAVRRTFTLREAGRILSAGGLHEGDDAPRRLAALVAELGRSRGAAAALDAADDDVVDPYRRGPAVWAQARAQMEPALRALAAALSASPAPPPSPR